MAVSARRDRLIVFAACMVALPLAASAGAMDPAVGAAQRASSRDASHKPEQVAPARQPDGDEANLHLVLSISRPGR